MQLHASGSPLSVIYNNTYYYVLNLQGDVVGIMDSTGAQVVAYTYDAWGRPLSTTGSLASTLGLYNPLRYRGYAYDRETGLYYLQSRYYNPTWGRFINADALVSTGQGPLGNNMFAYCLNNPVNRLDVSGSVSIWYYLMQDHDMGFIHRAVVNHIKANNAFVSTEVVLSTFGRADVVDRSKGAVWEVKHAGKNPLGRIGEALGQALGYILLNDELSCLGSAGVFSGSFYIQCLKYSYLVEYTTPTAGVVLYTVSEVDNYSGEYLSVYIPVNFLKRKTEKAASPTMSGCFYMAGVAVLALGGGTYSGINDGLDAFAMGHY